MASKKDMPPEPQGDGAPPVITLWPVEKLIPYARNARTHSATQVDQIAAAFDEFGFVGAIVVRDGTIAKGHGSILAIKKLYDAKKRLYPAPGKKGAAEPYPKGTVPVLEVNGWSDAQFRAYVVADNKLAQNAGWDNEMLMMELGDITSDGFDLGVVGFSPQEMNALLGLDEPAAPGADEPPAGDAYKEQFAIMVLCKSEPDQQRIYNELQAQGYDLKVVTT